jgi:hypothetical protein
MITLIQCTSSQPVSTNSEKVDNSLWIRPSSDSESNDTDNDDSMPKLVLLHSEYNRMHEPNSLEPVRRANFWKRANFWRKRANFW